MLEKRGVTFEITLGPCPGVTTERDCIVDLGYIARTRFGRDLYNAEVPTCLAYDASNSG
jgi:hypothetical protein